MSQEVLMPRLSDTMEEGTIARWVKKVGDHVEKGDLLVEIETDKANMEFNSYSSGVLEQILVKEGEVAKISQPIAVISSSGEAPSVSSAVSTPAVPAPVEAPATKAPEPAPVPVATAPAVSAPAAAVAEVNGARLKASPLARAAAAERGLDLRLVSGTGPGGRIVRDDVLKFTPAAVAPAVPAAQPTVVAPTTPAVQAAVVGDGVTTKTLTRMQQVIVRRMVEAKTQVPHFYVSNEIDMEEALALRQRMNAGLDRDQQVRLDAIIIRACALALKAFPDVNASYKDGLFEYHDAVNIGFAVSIPNGLVVPVLRNCDQKGIRQLDQEMRPFIERSRSGKLTPTDLDGSTFSISNLGMYDVEEFGAVINQPNAAILAVGTTKPVPAVVDGQIVVRQRMKVTVSCDHRVLYGAIGAQFLKELKRLLQSPYSLVL